MRHGRTEWNAQGKLQGRFDSPLLPESIESIRYMGKSLKTRNIACIYSSPLDRCRKSVEIICGTIHTPVIFVDDLVECDHGKCEGLTLDESKRLFPGFFAEREFGNKWNVKWPDGESYADIARRLKRIINMIDLTRSSLIVAHETVNKILAGLLLGFSQDKIIRLKQRNHEIFRLDLVNIRLDILDCQT
jgi:broad specificity phosphatase PhoE